MRLSLILLLLFCGNLFAQQKKKTMINLKVQSRVLADYGSEFQTLYHLTGIQPAIQFQRFNGHIHQIEFYGLGASYSHNDRGASANTMGFSLGYEYLFPLPFSVQNERFLPYFGVGMLHTLELRSYRDVQRSEFRQTIINSHSELYLSPSFRTMLSDRLFLDISLMLPFFDVDRLDVRSTNPAVTFDESEDSLTREFYFVKRVIFRFGFGVRL